VVVVMLVGGGGVGGGNESLWDHADGCGLSSQVSTLMIVLLQNQLFDFDFSLHPQHI
jgi:hypothetical protein